TEREFPHAPPLTGTLEYRSDQGEAISVGALHAFVQNQGDAWQYTLDSLSQYFEAALVHRQSDYPLPEPLRHPFEARRVSPPAQTHELIGTYLDAAELLGRRTAELHLALGSDYTHPDFSPEPFTDHYRQALYHSWTALTTEIFLLLRPALNSITGSAQATVQRVIERQDHIRSRFRLIPDRKVASMRIRIHDDLRLARVLYTGKDFVFIGFDGRPERPLSEK